MLDLQNNIRNKRTYDSYFRSVTVCKTSQGQSGRDFLGPIIDQNHMKQKAKHNTRDKNIMYVSADIVNIDVVVSFKYYYY